MIKQYPVYIFDIDGTLMDSAADICGAILETLSVRGRTEFTRKDVQCYIGRHLLEMYTDMGFDPAEIDPMIADYRRIYLGREHANTHVFTGVTEMLGRLEGRKATATTKGTPTTRAVLQQFGLIQFFDHVQGTDGFPAKPQPDVVLRSVEALGAEPEECLLVGDSAADMEAGRRAGVHTCAVRWGYGDPGEMAKWSPDYWIDRPADLLAEAIV